VSKDQIVSNPDLNPSSVRNELYPVPANINILARLPTQRDFLRFYMQDKIENLSGMMVQTGSKLKVKNKVEYLYALL
jgi:hypothetical protein